MKNPIARVEVPNLGATVDNLRSRVSRQIFARREAMLKLDMRTIAGPVLITGTSVWAHYELTPQLWGFQSLTARSDLLDLLGRRWGSLGGHAIKLRQTMRPYGAAEWAQRMHERTPEPLRDADGAVGYHEWLRARQVGNTPPLSYDGWLEAQQRQVQAARLDRKLCVLSVRIGDPSPKLDAAELWDAARDPSYESRSKPVVELVRNLREITDALTGDGFEARPLSSFDLEWLIHRSCAVGMPAPSSVGLGGDVWSEHDVIAFSDSVSWSYTPFGRSVKVTAHRDGEEFSRHVVVLTAGKMEKLNFPESGKAPWMTFADRLEFPVEWSLSGDIHSGRELARYAEQQRDRSVNIRKHYHEHGELPPEATDRAIRRSIEMLDEITEGTPDVGARFFGVVRVAIGGDTEDEAISRARVFQQKYIDNLDLHFEHPAGQWSKLAEFLPGQAWESIGYQRVMPVRYLAAGIPHTSSEIGDGVGPYLGYGDGVSRFAFMLDSNYGPEVMHRSGLCPILAVQGAGKSTLTGFLAYNEVRRGVKTVILDPSGPLARLVAVPELAPFSQHVSLWDGEPGSLNPCLLLPDPPRENATDDEWLKAKLRQDQQRKQVLIDTLRSLVPPTIRALADELLPQVTRGVTVSTTTTPWEIITKLESVGKDGKRLAGAIRDALDSAEGVLILGEQGHLGSALDVTSALTVITLNGIDVPPEDLPEAQWSIANRLAHPMLNLSILFASRFIYTGSPNTRRALHLDEVHFLQRWASGAAFFKTLTRDSRKRNTAVFASSQLPDDVLGLGVEDQFSHAFIGRLEDPETAKKGLRLLRTPEGYVSTVTKLSLNEPGQFLYRDLFGRVQKIRVHVGYLPHVLEALLTDPDGSTAADYGGEAA